MSFSLIVPTYNESENISAFLDGVAEALGPRGSYEIIVVDDNSPDGTWEKVERYALAHPWVRVLRRTEDRGLSSAVLAGFEVAKGQLLGVMDADMSHDEAKLPLLIQAVEEGAELAVGSRRVPGGGAEDWPWHRQLTSSVATFLAKHFLHIHLTDPMSGFFVLDRALYESCRDRLEPRGYKILLEIYCKGGPTSVVEIPFVFRDRKQGYSKMSLKVISHYLQMLRSLRQKERKLPSK